MNFKVIFQLDGCGTYYDPNEPIHLDALLAWILTPMQSVQRGLQRDEKPDDIRLPLLEESIGGSKVWKASALFPTDAEIETLRFFRKRFRQNYIELTTGSPNLQNGIYREYNVPLPLNLSPVYYAYASGNCKEVKRLLKRHLKTLGKKRLGNVVDIICEETPQDWSWVKDGKAMRYLPKADGTRLVRCRPPYWNAIDRVPCCEIGDDA